VRLALFLRASGLIELEYTLFNLLQAEIDTNSSNNEDWWHGNLNMFLTEVSETGYRIVSSEGVFYPIINYNYYEKYKSSLTDDMRSYIEIMVMESNNPPAEDGGLVIGWDELIKRALTQEAFINSYPESLKIDGIKELHKRYVRFALFGLDNTPLFDFETKTLDEEIKEIYKEAININEDSKFIDTLEEYLNLLEKNDDLETDEVLTFRKNKLENIF